MGGPAERGDLSRWHGGSGRVGTALRLLLLTGVLCLVFLSDTGPLAGDSEGEVSTGLRIPRKIFVRYATSAIPPPPGDGGGELLGSVIEVRVDTNIPEWGLAVRVALPWGGELSLAPGLATCRLRDGSGAVVSEGAIEGDEVVLAGNGRCGSHTFFLEVVWNSEEKIPASLSGLVVGVRGLEDRD